MSIEELDKKKFKHDNGWIYGNLITNGTKPYIVGDLVEANEECIAHEFWVRVIPESIGQYTGIKNKEGIKIYENDIVDYMHHGIFGNKWVVGFTGGSFTLNQTPWRVNIRDLVRLQDIKVIGNTIDHPEALRGVTE